MKSRVLLVVLLFICLAALANHQVFADTDGSELQIFSPSQLEIQLGADWAGAQFELRTDMGIYPQPIRVDDTGILKLEIGGSSEYVLSCLSLGSAHSVPAANRPGSTTQTEHPAETVDEPSRVGAPVLLLAGILLFAAGTLAGCGVMLIQRHKA